MPSNEILTHGSTSQANDLMCESIVNFQPSYTDTLAFPYRSFEESILG